jgi:thioredoxin 1/thioredoxin 2
MEINMTSIAITEENFSATIESHSLVILDFWAAWCGPCKNFAPVFEAASARHQDIVFGKIDTDAEQALAGAFNIRSIPTLMVLRDKIMVYREAGAMTAGNFEQLITHIRALDMHEIRAEFLAREEGDPDSPG